MTRNFRNSKIKIGTEKENYVPNNNCMSGIFDLPGYGGYGGMGGGPSGYGAFGGGANAKISPLSEPWEMIYNNSYYLLSLLRVVLTYAYVIHGPLRTLVDLPVYDMNIGKIKIKTDEAEPEDIEELNRFIKRNKIYRKVINAIRWERLYGGSGIILNTNQDYKTPFDINSINETSVVNFIVADRWQLILNAWSAQTRNTYTYNPGAYTDVKDKILPLIDESRVFRIVGEEAPALIRQRLQGYGMSVIECVIRQINLYFKEENVLFELIDEAKVDVYSIEGFNANILNLLTKNKTAKRIEIANELKNYMNAIVMDAKDKYEQKQIAFSGLADIMKQLQIGIASACRMPVSKLFGLSATGFDSGESDLETYNAIVETEREKAEEVLEKVLPVCMMKLWGVVPDDWSIEWPTLRVLTKEQEMNIKVQQYEIDRTMFQDGVLNPVEYCEKLKEDDLLLMETEVGKGTVEPEARMPAMAEGEDNLGEDKAPKKESSGKTPKKAKT